MTPTEAVFVFVVGPLCVLTVIAVVLERVLRREREWLESRCWCIACKGHASRETHRKLGLPDETQNFKESS